MARGTVDFHGLLPEDFWIAGFDIAQQNVQDGWREGVLDDAGPCSGRGLPAVCRRLHRRMRFRRSGPFSNA